MIDRKKIIDYKIRALDDFDRIKSIELLNKLYWWWFTGTWYKEGTLK
ncbi:hypothetical protein BMS3Abin10_01470 [bacterium BMS3Abin10]|nr:hypothetical protein BMS3Abin10_01470 [bacterium BMS3Abin10]GBE39596.1 hypothetical protein BMS3Bbin08_02222 [bacterium BMS3Bbin08]